MSISGAGIHIVDTRTPGLKSDNEFNGFSAAVYLQCDAAHTITALTEQPALTVIDVFLLKQFEKK
jgi:hypothetical protein